MKTVYKLKFNLVPLYYLEIYKVFGYNISKRKCTKHFGTRTKLFVDFFEM